MWTSRSGQHVAQWYEQDRIKALFRRLIAHEKLVVADPQQRYMTVAVFSLGFVSLQTKRISLFL